MPPTLIGKAATITAIAALALGGGATLIALATSSSSIILPMAGATLLIGLIAGIARAALQSRYKGHELASIPESKFANHATSNQHFAAPANRSPKKKITTVIPSMRGTAQRGITRYDIKPNEDEKKDIAYIFNTLGSANAFKVRWRENEMKAAGARLRRIHPLRFLAFPYMDKDLREQMQKIIRRQVPGFPIWHAFSESTKAKLDRQANADNVVIYADAFAQEIGYDVAMVKKILQDRNWDALFELLFVKKT